MACCIAAGQDWHGHRVEQGAVFYIAGEGHNGLGRRFSAWQKHYNVDLSGTPLFVSHKPAQFYDAASALDVSEAVETLSSESSLKPRFIIIDTLARNFGGGDENSTKDMNQFVQHVDALKDNWQASVLIVHHTGHGDKSRARGSMALKGALDHEYGVTKAADNTIELSNTKMKDAEAPKSLGFEILPVELDFPDEDGNAMIGAVVCPCTLAKRKGGLSLQQRKAYLHICDCITDKGQERYVRRGMRNVVCITKDECRTVLKSNNITNTDKMDSLAKAITRAMDGLQSKGFIVTYENYVWLADK